MSICVTRKNGYICWRFLLSEKKSLAVMDFDAFAYWSRTWKIAKYIFHTMACVLMEYSNCRISRCALCINLRTSNEPCLHWSNDVNGMWLKHRNKYWTKQEIFYQFRLRRSNQKRCEHEILWAQLYYNITSWCVTIWCNVKQSLRCQFSRA